MSTTPEIDASTKTQISENQKESKKKTQNSIPNKSISVLNLVKETQNSILHYAEKTSGLSRATLLMSAGLFIFAVRRYFGIDHFWQMVAFIFPAYRTYKVLKRDDIVEHIHCLMYWVVWGLFNALHGPLGYTLFWFSHYSFVKCCFLFWMIWPSSKGAVTIYNSFIKVFLEMHSKRIDVAIAWIEKTSNGILGEIRQFGGDLIRETISNTILSRIAFARKSQDD